MAFRAGRYEFRRGCLHRLNKIGLRNCLQGVKRMINKERLIAISDGIIAVAATVMVLRLDIPEMVSLSAIRERVPILIAYIISYMQIFLAWHEHHDSFINAEKINHRVFLMNTLWLFLITMLPFVTGVLGQSPTHRPTILLYLAVLALQICVQMLECRMIENLNGIRMQDAEVVNGIRVLTLVGCGIAAAFAFFCPAASIWIVVLASLVSVVLIVRYDRMISNETFRRKN